MKKMSWAEHISNINRKIAKGIGIICKARNLLNQTSCLSLYFSFIYPFLTYCVEVWGSTYPTILSPLIKSLKKAVRILTFSHPREHTEPLFKQLGLFIFSSIYTYFLLIFVYKFLKNKLPPSFNNIFQINSSRRDRSTRQDQCFTLPRVTLTSSQHSVRCNGARLWNRFSREFDIQVDNINTLSFF